MEYLNSRRPNKFTPIYCLMITGKTEQRRHFAKIALANFNIQTYPNKYLIIINEGSHSTLNNYTNERRLNNVMEVMINKRTHGLTLGDLRNISLEMVPPDAIWTTWDDDDWRHETYLEVLCNRLKKNPSHRYLLYQNRLEYNFKTGFSWKVRIRNGTSIVFAYKDSSIKYDSLNVNEDVIVKQLMLSRISKGAGTIYDNDPLLYIRFVHNDNTSIYVDSKKEAIRIPVSNMSNVIESEAVYRDKKYIHNVVKKHYSMKN